MRKLLTAVLAGGVLIGSQIGPRLAIKTEQTRLKKYFALLLLIISGWLLWGVFQ